VITLSLGAHETGAHHNPRTSMWLGGDANFRGDPSIAIGYPLALSPGEFTAWNPMRTRDFDGRDDVDDFIEGVAYGVGGRGVIKVTEPIVHVIGSIKDRVVHPSPWGAKQDADAFKAQYQQGAKNDGVRGGIANVLYGGVPGHVDAAVHAKTPEDLHKALWAIAFTVAIAKFGGEFESALPQGRVAYGSTDLSLEAINYRMAQNIQGGQNIAVFEYETAAGLKTIARASERGVGHAERIIAKELEEMGVAPTAVRRIYSELEPCSVPGGYCSSFIERTYPQAEVTHSFEYGETVASREAGVAALKAAVARIFGGD
jgi:hypothetical protein